ncbi:hypothetical protein [Amphibacillus xylanus]|uniref:DUF4064 domain-containing protein n=1 Tax=Amphibacillus xylanus (strain ATCC 51415 / DSM 6626 / JCM 7361 / LMG 17667 / NBRC 15112 / Ep01) TaxID=698758 RepID=K0IZD9_AMPXN|nr:hypothetical protein [Amphibacillus xylanus]BAM46337.1 hypothetical protein AXY_02050 [Amphibacillus xylanus NBRC 15112]
MKIRNNAAQVIGWIFIVAGIIFAILIVASFDYEYYNYVKDFPVTEDQLDFLESELVSTWVYATILLFGHVAVGVVIMTLGKILSYVQLMALGNEEVSNQ